MDNATIVCYVGGLCFVPASSVTGPFLDGSEDDYNAMIIMEGGDYRWVKLTAAQADAVWVVDERISAARAPTPANWIGSLDD
jgi:hypothetical protein